MEIKERLKKISILKGLLGNEGSFDKLVDIIEPRKFQKGDVIIKEGAVEDTLYLLNEGKVRVEKKTLQGEPYTICTITEMDNAFFGEQAMLEKEVRSASVIAETYGECFIIKKADFEKFCLENPRDGLIVIRDIALLLSRRLRKTSQDNITLFEALVEEIGED